MVEVSVEVRSGTARFRVAVRAAGVGRAASLAGERYSREGVRLNFPTRPEGRVTDAPGSRAGIAA